ncbi:MAG: hypothetical protein KBD94_01405 [Pyrinomonadaceae bacterium]|nr:hypothetical protein [Pyrinomonadaceae bacterium]
MKSANHLIALATLLAVGFVFGPSCRNLSTSTSGPAPTTDVSADNPPKPVEKDIAGDYSTTGTNPDGKGEYKADLTITKHGEVFQFSWASGGNEYDGVGVVNGDHAAVSYTDGKDGKGCGVILYQIKEDGTLQGKSGYWGVNEAEVETARRTSGSGLEGTYSIKGTNPNGKDYSGDLTVSKAGEGYTFKWNADQALQGFGIRAGNMIAVGFGGKQCSFVGYDIKEDGTLDGQWGSAASKTFGTEVAKRK